MNNNNSTPSPIDGLDAVQMMREIREKLSERYWQHTEVLKQDMEAIRKKYNFKLTHAK